MYFLGAASIPAATEALRTPDCKDYFISTILLTAIVALVLLVLAIYISFHCCVKIVEKVKNQQEEAINQYKRMDKKKIDQHENATEATPDSKTDATEETNM